MIETAATLSRSLLRSALYVGLLFSVAACTHTEGQPPPGASLTESEQASEAEQKKVAAPMNLNGQIEFSKKDLANRLDVPPETILLSDARQVTWRSGALGCPKPGMNYTQALIPGSLIILQVGNRVHAYHAKFGSEPFYCPRDRAEQPVLEADEDLT